MICTQCKEPINSSDICLKLDNEILCEHCSIEHLTALFEDMDTKGKAFTLGYETIRADKI